MEFYVRASGVGHHVGGPYPTVSAARERERHLHGWGYNTWVETDGGERVYDIPKRTILAIQEWIDTPGSPVFQVVAEEEVERETLRPGGDPYDIAPMRLITITRHTVRSGVYAFTDVAIDQWGRQVAYGKPYPPRLRRTKEG